MAEILLCIPVLTPPTAFLCPSCILLKDTHCHVSNTMLHAG